MCHNYPREDGDSFVDSPNALREFIANRAAGAFSLQKPLVLESLAWEWMVTMASRKNEWLRLFWRGTCGPGRRRNVLDSHARSASRLWVTYTSARDSGVLAEIGRASQMFASLQSADPPDELTEAGIIWCRAVCLYAWRGRSRNVAADDRP